MQITRQADYAVRAVVYLAERGGGKPIATAEIGRQQHIPLTFLAKIMSQLSAGGIVHTLRGAHGASAWAGQRLRYLCWILLRPSMDQCC